MRGAVPPACATCQLAAFNPTTRATLSVYSGPMSTVYTKWGFTANPFQQTPLPASADGSRLIVGRNDEIAKLRVLLGAPPKLVTVEGRNGIGKTSVINVAAYTAYQSWLNDPHHEQPLVPCAAKFQLSHGQDVDAFVAHVLHNVVLSVESFYDELRDSGRQSPILKQLVKWIGDPVIKSKGVGANLSGFGGSYTSGSAANTTDGFKVTGFEARVREMLRELFPAGSGGVVCVLDNLELLKTSSAARELIEQLRDRLLNLEGLRWVLAGSAGIIFGLCATPRMSGYLHNAVHVQDVSSKLAGNILRRRREVFAINDSARLPLHVADFELLFNVLASNVRDTLSEADNFCTEVALNDRWHPEDGESRELFQDWLRTQCMRRLQAADALLSDKPWEVFRKMIELGGTCAPGDFKSFGFETQQAMRSHVLSLESAQLIQSLRDEDDNRRKTILVTSNGWMVHYARENNFGNMFEGR
jgi:hypothetical protein